jgi:hypothetical protein
MLMLLVESILSVGMLLVVVVHLCLCIRWHIGTTLDELRRSWLLSSVLGLLYPWYLAWQFLLRFLLLLLLKD